MNPDSERPLPENQESEAMSDADSGKITSDLRKEAVEAVRMMQEKGRGAQHVTTEMPAIVNERRVTTGNLDPTVLEAQSILKRMNYTVDTGVLMNRRLFDENTTLRLDVDGHEQPIRIEMLNELVVGRNDNLTNYTPDLDLSAYGAYRLGLSRRHALLRRNETRLEIIDLGSRNGTLINGELLDVQQPYVLQDADTLQFGNLRVSITFERRTTR